MYCIKCGVELADSENRCPLCGTVVFHPELPRVSSPKPYPDQPEPEERFSPSGIMFVITSMMLLAAIVCLICDLELNSSVVWSGYVIFGLLLFYVAFVLPFWFKKPNPTVLFPVFAVACILFLLYVDLKTGGRWFLSFAFPVAGGVGLMITAVIALVKYLRRGRLFVFGGLFIILGAFCLLIEFLADITFHSAPGFNWCFYPLAVLCFLGLTLIIIALVPPFRESFQKKLFI